MGLVPRTDSENSSHFALRTPPCHVQALLGSRKPRHPPEPPGAAVESTNRDSSATVPGSSPERPTMSGDGLPVLLLADVIPVLWNRLFVVHDSTGPGAELHPSLPELWDRGGKLRRGFPHPLV